MQALSNHHRSFAIDLWGFGDSSKVAGDYGLEAHVAMLSGFVDKLGIARPFTLVGHSLGAAVALRYASLAPASVGRIATIALPLTSDSVNGHLSAKSAANLLGHSRSKFGAYPEVTMGLDKADVKALQASVAQVDLLNLVDELNNVVCPILHIFGARDTLVKAPSEELNDTEGTGSEHHWVSLDESSHFPMLEQPAVFNRLLREFINSTDASDLSPKNYWQRRMR